MLGELDAWRIAFIALAAVAGSIVAGLSGMGGGMLIAIAITPVIGLKPLVPTMTIAMLVNHLFRVWVFRREIDWSRALPVLASAVPGAVVGAAFYVSLAPRMVALVMGAFLLSVVPLRRLFDRRAWRIGRGGLVGAGGVFGLVSGTTLGGGILIVPVLLGSGLAGASFIGTDAVIGLVILLTKAATFGGLDLLSRDLVIMALVVGLGTLPGTYLARWIIQRTSVLLHVAFIEVIIVAGGLSFLWRGLRPD